MPEASLPLFQPEVADELVRGWQSHVARRRIIHDRAARRAQRWHYVVGSLATSLAAFAGSSMVSSWTTDPDNDGLALVGGTMVSIAGVLAGIQTFLDLGGRAERHRQAANEYKGLLRQFERLSERRVLDAVCGPMDDKELCSWIANVQDALRVVDDKAPVAPWRLAKSIERLPLDIVTNAGNLVSPSASVDEEPPS